MAKQIILIPLLVLTYTVYGQKKKLEPIEVNIDSSNISVYSNNKIHILKYVEYFNGQKEKYKIEIFQDSISTVFKLNEKNWKQLFIIDISTKIELDKTSQVILPAFQLLDFNEDGFYDLKILSGTNIHGNQWTKLYLYNVLKKRLEILVNYAENSTDWDAPEYNFSDSTIHCQRLSNNWGVSFISSYKLKGNYAIPLEKQEEDNTDMNILGKGRIVKYYIGVKKKWKLKRKSVLN